MKTNIKLLLFTVLMFVLVVNFHADDKELFMGLDVSTEEVKPNVLILMDNSGSMNTIVFYPKNGIDGEEGTSDDGYDPAQLYSGGANGMGNRTTTRSVGRWYSYNDNWAYTPSTPANDNDQTHIYTVVSDTVYEVGPHGMDYFNVGEKIMAASFDGSRDEATCVITSKWQDDSSGTMKYYFEVEDIIGGPITTDSNWNTICFERRDPDLWDPRAVRLYGISDNGEATRYPREYTDWLYCHATDFHRAAVSHFSTYGTFDVNVIPDWKVTNCSAPGQLETTQQALFTRIQVAREVLCQVAKSVNERVKLGLFKFQSQNGSSSGAEAVDELGDMSEEVALVDFIKKIYDVPAETWTPLAEALADVWFYYKPGPASKTYWPVDVEIENGTYTPGPNPVTPVDWWCQNNYVVIMTDGESTMDRFNETGAGDNNQDGRYAGSIFLTNPVKRTEPWNSWDDGWGDPDDNEESIDSPIPAGYNPSTSTYCRNYTCWYADNGSDYLDDVAYFLNHQDMFPEDPNGYPDGFIDDPGDPEGFPGKQNIYTYVIGFNADNDMLRETAINGDGAYYTATNYEELVDAFESVLTSILLRNFAFSAITAPKKTASIQSEGVSYVGYFMPSQSASVWEGHLLANRLYERYGFDTDTSGIIDFDEIYDNEQDCLDANPGEVCTRILELAAAAEWDVATILANRSSDRVLYTFDGTSMVAFTAANRDAIKTYFGAGTTDTEADQIIDKINQKWLGDVFHSDIDFVGPPLGGKKYIPNINPVECDSDPTTDADCYQYYYTQKSSRERVIFVGTNDGILHMISAENGQELWGFIPQEVLPSLKNIVVNGLHTYTVDGRITADDIYYRDATTSGWKTILIFGLRDGGTTYYCLDVSDVSSMPTLLWKFEDSTFSGNSWGSPVIGQINIKVGASIERRWVVFLTGGFAFDNEISADQSGKAIFVVDASTGALLYSVGYDAINGEEDDTGTPQLETTSSDNIHYLTQDDVFNFPIPTSMSPVDTDSNGLIDAVYFGNTGGHMFKLNISNPDVTEWKTYVLYKTVIADVATATIGSIVDDVFDIGNDVSNFEIGWNIVGMTSGAIGYITDMDSPKKEITVKTMRGTFQVDEVIKTRSYDSIYNPPAVAYDTCYQLWVTFGTGDRDRPRTDPGKGRFIALIDNNVFGTQLSGLSQLSWSGDNLTQTTIDPSDYIGWYFDFPDDSEKLFDPEHVILPDENFVPHIYLNTYQPPEDTNVGPQENPCDAPSEGDMRIYDISIAGCSPVIVSGQREEGRIAGGGIYKGKEYVKYIGSGQVGSVPPLDDVDSDMLEYAGTIIFWKERKR